MALTEIETAKKAVEIAQKLEEAKRKTDREYQLAGLMWSFNFLRE